MTGPHKTWAALILIVPALALGACGGDDEGGNESATTGTDTAATGTGTNGTDRTKTTETTEAKTNGTTTRERERERDSGGSGGSGSGGGGGSGGGSNGSDGGGGGGGGEPSPDLNAGNAEKTAKTVCSGFLPKQTERDIKSGKKTRQEVAREYSRGFPRELRDEAYDGCLAGLPKKN